MSNIQNVPGRVLGTTTNDSATTGYVGEYVESTQSTATNFTTSNQWGSLVNITLTAGDWDISALLAAVVNGATMTGDITAGIGTASGNAATGMTEGVNRASARAPTSTDGSSITIPPYRVSISATTTYYLKYLAIYSAGTPQARGRLSARRIR